MGAPRSTSAHEDQELPHEEPPKERLLIREEQFCDWVAHAPPGRRVEYYRGFLAFDRMPSSGGLNEPDRRALVAVAKRVMQVAADGRVAPVQLRRGDGVYSYIATKTRHRRAGGAGANSARGGLPCRR